MSESKKQPMKTLATCSPVEFLRQTNKIRHIAAKWLENAGIAEIRKRQPPLTGKETPEELKAVRDAQAKKNLDEMADALLDTHAEETVQIMGLMCFMEPGEIESMSGLDLLAPAVELLNSKAVADFLLFLMQSALMNMDG